MNKSYVKEKEDEKKEGIQESIKNIFLDSQNVIDALFSIFIYGYEYAKEEKREREQD